MDLKETPKKRKKFDKRNFINLYTIIIYKIQINKSCILES